MIKLAVLDDEKIYLDMISTLLAKYKQEKNVQIRTELFSNANELLEKIELGEKYDVFLLDIYMQGLTGMSVATELRSRNVKSPIVFLTSSTDHALEAFGVNATHYLLKPYTEENFFFAMDKAMQSIEDNSNDSIVIKVDNGYRYFTVKEILYVEAEDKYQRIYLSNGEKVLVRITSTELCEKVKDFDCFFRCGRSHIINLNHVRKVTTSSVLLKTGTELKLSHAAIATLKTAFFNYFN
jgi:DNA-binding LytR/AlgR family response regulator